MDAATAKTATFNVALSGPLSLSGTATVTRTSGGYDAALTTTVDGVTVTAEYIGSTVYVSAGNIHISGTAARSKTSSPGRESSPARRRRCRRQCLRAVFPRAHAAVRREQHPGPRVVE